ncbi:MAG: hypothetical protein ACYS6W_17440 [Planctomycetota bacterium]|jgi:hypothetical protein
MPKQRALTSNELTSSEEAAFQEWYARVAADQGLDPNPDDVRHFYDWRSAFLKGAVADETGHFPSEFKLKGHPNLIIGGVDTSTGKRVRKNSMPLPHKKKKKPKITTALGRAAKAGVRRAIAGPTKQEKAREEAARIDKQQADARAAARADKKAKSKPKQKPKPKSPFARLNEALGGGQ